MDTIATIGIYCLDRAPPGPPCHLVNRERVLVEHKHLRRNRPLSVVLNPQKLVVHCCSCVSLCQSRVSQLFVQCNFPETHWIGPREKLQENQVLLVPSSMGSCLQFFLKPKFQISWVGWYFCELSSWDPWISHDIGPHPQPPNSWFPISGN